MPYKYKTIEKINVLYCTSVTKQCFHVQREKCVCLTYSLPFGNKCIHLNQNGTFFTITVFCMPDVRNMLLHKQTKNLVVDITKSMHVLAYSSHCLSSCGVSCTLEWESPGLACGGSMCKRFGSMWQSGVLFAHTKAYFSPGLR